MGFFSSKKDNSRDSSPSSVSRGSSSSSILICRPWTSRSSSPSSSSSRSPSSNPNVPCTGTSSCPCPTLDWADAQFENTFNNGCYTSLVMLDFLITRRQLSYKEYLLDRSLVLDKTDSQEYRSRKKGKNKNNEVARNEFPRTKAWLNQFPDSDFDNVVNNGTGRCTSFAIQNVTRLGKAHGAHYEFDYYKLGVHHLARCRKSEIVIDSSSKKGAFLLKPGRRSPLKCHFSDVLLISL